MTTSQILKSVDFTKMQRSRYLENKTLFFLEIKNNNQLYIKDYFTEKTSFVAVIMFQLSRGKRLKYHLKC